MSRWDPFSIFVPGLSLSFPSLIFVLSRTHSPSPELSSFSQLSLSLHSLSLSVLSYPTRTPPHHPVRRHHHHHQSPLPPSAWSTNPRTLRRVLSFFRLGFEDENGAGETHPYFPADQWPSRTFPFVHDRFTAEQGYIITPFSSIFILMYSSEPKDYVCSRPELGKLRHSSLVHTRPSGHTQTIEPLALSSFSKSGPLGRVCVLCMCWIGCTCVCCRVCVCCVSVPCLV